MKSLPVAAMVLVVLTAACTSTKPPGLGRVLESQVLASFGPRIPNGAVLAADDLATLRALVDADGQETAREMGGQQLDRQCSPPYFSGRNACWPDQISRAGRGYLAIDLRGGFCEQLESTAVSVQSNHIQVRLDFSTVGGCHLNGVLAMPTAGLISFSTIDLPAALYSVSYVTVNGGDAYTSASTYLSNPAPAPEAQEKMQGDASTALGASIGTRTSSVFSVSRVDGRQLGALCSTTLQQPAYLVISANAPPAGPREMTVILAGEPPRVCRVSPI